MTKTTSIAISKEILEQGRLLASARKKTFSELVEALIKDSFTVTEITDAAMSASETTREIVPSERLGAVKHRPETDQAFSAIIDKVNKQKVTATGDGGFVSLDE